MTGHSPGPWVISQPWPGFIQITGGDGKLIFGFAAGSADEKYSDEECDANARLIAAAPDLVAALRGILEGWKRGALSDAMFEPIATARTLLAKIKDV